MKDKITVTIVCSFLIGMYWISRSTSIDSLNESFISIETAPLLLEDTTMDFIDYDAPENTLIDKIELQTDIAAINQCRLEPNDTDDLTFGDAFRYYRQCLGTDSSFQWKGIDYTTLISEEVLIQVVDSIKVDDNSEEAGVSQIR